MGAFGTATSDVHTQPRQLLTQGSGSRSSVPTWNVTGVNNSIFWQSDGAWPSFGNVPYAGKGKPKLPWTSRLGFAEVTRGLKRALSCSTQSFIPGAARILDLTTRRHVRRARVHVSRHPDIGF